jgi:hypothetical protein
MINETIQEAAKRLNLKIGDKVKVLCKAEDFSNNWLLIWNEQMDSFVGQICKVTNNNSGKNIRRGVLLTNKNNSFYFPHFVLEKVVEETIVENTNNTQVPVVGKEPTILEKANKLVYGDRQQQYGSASQNFNDIAIGWSVITKTTITAEQVALMMGWLKICRANVDNGNHEDSLIDCAGYMACIEKIKKGL